jgi:hypothetical protein
MNDKQSQMLNPKAAADKFHMRCHVAEMIHHEMHLGVQAAGEAQYCLLFCTQIVHKFECSGSWQRPSSTV